MAAAFDLTTRVRVKDLLSLTEVTKDTLIDQIITSTSGDIVKFLNRGLKSEARVEQYNIEPGQQLLFLRAFPVDDPPTPLFRQDTGRQFTVPDIDADSFFLDLERGEADFDRTRLISGPGVMRVTYTGGMAIDTADFITKFPEIAQAADFQVAFMFKRRDTLGTSSFSAEGGSVSFDQLRPLIPSVKASLQPFRRLLGRHS